MLVSIPPVIGLGRLPDSGAAFAVPREKNTPRDNAARGIGEVVFTGDRNIEETSSI
jgi:hypothetical protein